MSEVHLSRREGLSCKIFFVLFSRRGKNEVSVTERLIGLGGLSGWLGGGGGGGGGWFKGEKTKSEGGE